MNIIIPMAGKGQRFIDAGYTDPKPFIDVLGKPMLQVAMENLGLKGRYYFLVRPEHTMQTVRVIDYLPKENEYIIVPLKQEYKGAAAACLSLRGVVNHYAPLVIANCDQIIDWNADDFANYCQTCGARGVVATFKATSPQHSYALSNEFGWVTKVAEKEVISDDALCGVHFWVNAHTAFDSFAKSLKGPPHYNGDYYIAPTYNEIIKNGDPVFQYHTKGMAILGTPQQLEEYIDGQRRSQ